MVFRVLVSNINKKKKKKKKKAKINKPVYLGL